VIISGDLVDQSVGAIVNAANNDLVPGGGIAGAIRTRGGAAIQRECDAHWPVSVGQAAITGAGELPAHHLIHVASMALGGRPTASSLKSSMDHSFRLAREHGVRTIAIPAVGASLDFRWMHARASWRVVCAMRSPADGRLKRCDSCFSMRLQSTNSRVHLLPHLM
jgi:O-acetyl-ADP-ribose deacetylase (regulator of RNase III)